MRLDGDNVKVKNKFLFLISSLVVLTILAIQLDSILALFSPASDVWLHIREHLLTAYIRNTVGIVFFTMLFSATIGTLLAFGVSCYEFPFRKTISLLLHLPLAIPPYIGAFVYVNMFGPGGYLFGVLGAGARPNAFWMAILVFTLFLYPYVFITVKGFLSRDMSSYIENARVLGKKEWQILGLIILPVAKTSIITGSVFTGLEVLGDFGVVNYLGLPTFSTAIFKSLFNFRDLDSALRLSGMVIVAVFVLLAIKGFVLRFRNLSVTTLKSTPVSRKRLSKGGLVTFYLFAGFVMLMSLFLPLLRLITWASMSFHNIRWQNMSGIIYNSILYSLVATGIIVLLALIIASFTRMAPHVVAAIYGKMTLISYSLPGPVVAITVLFFMLTLADIFHFSVATTGFMLLLGYVVRYLGIAYENVDNGYKKLGMKHHQVARTLGKGYYKTLLTVDIPMLKPFILSGAALAFMDLIRELPLTLALRPFNFHTLATQTYQFASNEMLPEIAIPSLMIVLISMCLILMLFRSRSNSQTRSKQQ